MERISYHDDERVFWWLHIDPVLVFGLHLKTFNMVLVKYSDNVFVGMSV